MEDVQKAVVRAGDVFGWEMKPVEPCLIVGTLESQMSVKVARVELTWQTLHSSGPARRAVQAGEFDGLDFPRTAPIMAHAL